MMSPLPTTVDLTTLRQCCKLEGRSGGMLATLMIIAFCFVFLRGCCGKPTLIITFVNLRVNYGPGRHCTQSWCRPTCLSQWMAELSGIQRALILGYL